MAATSFAARLHHHASTDGVEGVGHEAGHGGHGLGDGPAHVDGRVLGIGKHACERGSIKKEQRTNTQASNHCQLTK